MEHKLSKIILVGMFRQNGSRKAETFKDRTISGT